ncbi:MAG: nuclear transport factor 2 family protein [Candidatus Chromulinivorax sp.]|nr:nuclear transport factor 2 family protein [Candidatus Chromulinivorax sp.]
MYKKLLVFFLPCIFMQTLCSMTMNSLALENKRIARAYYTAMAEKNIVALQKYVDEDVVFVAPLATVYGKELFLERVQEFFTYSATLTIRSVFGSYDQGMVVFSLEYPRPIGIVEVAALLHIEEGLITKIELFYDGRLFEKQEDAR